MFVVLIQRTKLGDNSLVWMTNARTVKEAREMIKDYTLEPEDVVLVVPVKFFHQEG